MCFFVPFSLLPQLSIAKMDPLSQVFCLKWNNHQNNLLTVLDHLYQTEAFCDVTLACDNTSIKCHKMILSACSSYFQTLFMENTCEHPIVFLKDIKIGEVRAILDYMYKGEVNVAQEELPGTILFTLFCLQSRNDFRTEIGCVLITQHDLQKFEFLKVHSRKIQILNKVYWTIRTQPLSVLKIFLLYICSFLLSKR